MDFSTNSIAEASVQKFLHIPYDQRWDYLKPVIVRMYMEENQRIARLAERMKDEYSFDAQAHQYRYHFKKWKIKKRITTEEKSAIIDALGKRRRQEGISTSDAILDQGDFKKVLDKKQLKRHIDQDIRQYESLTITPGLFLRYPLPYAALVRSLGFQTQHPSPSNTGPATPEYLTVSSPPMALSPSASQNAMSPTMQLVQRKLLHDRARLFVEGREQDLIAQMTVDERELTSTWLHDFWIYSFMTAKYWGRGPKTWTMDLVHFKSLPRQLIMSTPVRQIEQGHPLESPLSVGSKSLVSPTQLCRWAIHCSVPEYEHIPSPPLSEPEERYDIDDESTWAEWPADDSSRSLASTIAQGLQQNAFTSVQSEDLPFAPDIITKAVEKSQDEMQADALGFAIMARNLDVVLDIVDSCSTSGSISEIFPFHLAAQYLDGAKSCCLIMNTLVNYLDGKNSVGLNYTDDSGHTVLDTLFVTILRSHSTAQPHMLSSAFTAKSRYSEPKVDPCGRWDADSPCIRQLLASGESTIPRDWKHMFCHTSVQAICHCISMIYMSFWRANIDTQSGLFVRRCSHCGLELKVGPLHALVLTAFLLANDGMPGENLFGMISCLVCLLTLRANPSATAEVSIPALLEEDSVEGCQHSRMDAAQLASRISRNVLNSWQPEVKLGWKTLVAVLEYSVITRRDTIAPFEDGSSVSNQLFADFSDMDSDNDMSYDDEEPRACQHRMHETEEQFGMKLVHCGNGQLGQVWAAIQAELLTYRRVNDGDSWLSPRFEMNVLLEGLEGDDIQKFNRLSAAAKDAANSRLKPYSRCGLFDAEHPACARREEACTSYYANLDDWERSAFIEKLSSFYD
ncbi:hypothetical protein GGR54DRAFT_641478 [Hypoxylon sp. NC1633]|nr:hypothetical protein GGR54DRAFT_641478 [Hypoxylon sp. NC1633]